MGDRPLAEPEGERREELRRRLTPSGYLRDALELDLAEFVQAHPDSHLVLVRLDQGSGELAAGLAATSASTAKHRSPPAPITHQTGELEQQTEGSVVAERFDQADAFRRMLRHDHFVTPLCKRAGAVSDTPLHVTLGRDPTRDLVLRHPSVSKQHGWLEVDDSGDLAICDAGSKNGIRLDGAPLNPNRAHGVQPGQDIQIGNVHLWLCTTTEFWNMLRQRL